MTKARKDGALRRVTIAGAAALALGAPATADAGPPKDGPTSAQRALEMRTILPGSARAAASATRSDPRTWLLGTAYDAATTAKVKAAGGRWVSDGAWSVPIGEAEALANALEADGKLRWAHPNYKLERRAYDVNRGGWARGAVVPPDLPTPAPGGATVAVVDSPIDASHPDLAGKVVQLPGSSTELRGPGDTHGTSVASMAAAADNGMGVIGVHPNATIASYGANDEGFTCANLSRGIRRAIDAKVSAINTSYGSTGEPCQVEYEVVQLAFGVGIPVVAAAGNEFQAGNPVNYPAALPHVLSVGALDEQLNSAEFSTANATVDVAAPGKQVPAAYPVAFDTEDGAQDGYVLTDGTSFASPMVAGAVAWLAQQRPEASAGQLSDLLRSTARDVGRPGYDFDNGWGLIQLGAAQAAETPELDPLEPNDDIEWVNGRRFARIDPPIWRGRGKVKVRASSDQYEDPADVYVLRIPGRRKATITLRPQFGDPDLFGWSVRAKSINGTGGGRFPGLLAKSVRNGSATDRITIRNRGSKAKRYYVEASINSQVETPDTRYTLTVGP